MEIADIVQYLKDYDGRPITLMEICGSHTAAIAKYGIRDILSDKIRLISGPGCPVCVTPSSYIDRLIELAKMPGTTVASFGDMLRVPGSRISLSEAKSEGASTVMVYSPADLLKLAENNPDRQYVFAAVGFETTAPVYTLLLDEIIARDIPNISLLTSIKTMPAAVNWIMDKGAAIDGFIAPGHVCAITGADYFRECAEKYRIPFSVAGFDDMELILAIYGLVRMIERGEYTVKNYYPSIVEAGSNSIAMDKLYQYFEPVSAMWRGMGEIAGSGLVLRPEYSKYDRGSADLKENVSRNKGCSCGRILMGQIEPEECPLFGRVCSPENPQGACMVSYEGACYQKYING